MEYCFHRRCILRRNDYCLACANFKVLVDFNYTDGAYPSSPLVQGLDGNFYGTNNIGGTNFNGTVFKVTPAGTLTTLYNFCAQACTDGGEPSELLLGTDGNFCGTTSQGGANGWGTVSKSLHRVR